MPYDGLDHTGDAGLNALQAARAGLWLQGQDANLSDADQRSGHCPTVTLPGFAGTYPFSNQRGRRC